jgi:hypothetical protein
VEVHNERAISQQVEGWQSEEREVSGDDITHLQDITPAEQPAYS